MYQPQKWKSQQLWHRELSNTALKKVIAEVLGIDSFDDDVVAERLDHIDVEGKDRLTFHLTDGTTCVRIWDPQLKKNSWTPLRKPPGVNSCVPAGPKPKGSGWTTPGKHQHHPKR
ncbi:hypothetical protein [Trueperella pyogenes]|uniref:hypothetical protein n=1 Tax=Trueperella pyogenes TaxID=1661 RepID=UPI001F0B846E|nr:hypothetical protein [Trueperella pyogenes]